MTTAAPSLDARNQIPARLARLGITDEFFARLNGVSKADFSRMMSGAKPLTGVQTVAFCKTLDVLEEMVAVFYPLQLRFKDPDLVRKWLDNPALPNLFALMPASIPMTQEQQDVRLQWIEFLGSDQ